MSRVNFYVWQGDDIKAGVAANHKTANGGVTYGSVGSVDIKKGDVVSLSYGASRGVYTNSGKGYEMEYPHGYMVRFGDGASVVLDAHTAINLKHQESDKATFDNIVAQQKERYMHQVTSLIEKKELELIEKHQKDVEQLAQNKQNQKSIISGALDKMELVLGKRKP